MPQTQMSFHIPVKLYLAIEQQAEIEGLAATRWMVEVAKSRLRALGKLPDDDGGQKRFRERTLRSSTPSSVEAELAESKRREQENGEIVRQVLQV